jgi:N-acetyl-anhydromuramyl-L-alanine amidase AmpD
MATSPITKQDDQTGVSPNCDSRDGAQVIWFLLHTQEGDGDAQSLAHYLQNANSGVSYHYTVDNSRTVIDVVDTDKSAWAVLSGNPRSINLCFAGSRVVWTRDEWFSNMQAGIDCAAWIAVQDARKYGIPIRTITPEQLGNDEAGIADHNAYTIGKHEGTHTDVGPNFPWDYLNSKLAEYSQA